MPSQGFAGRGSRGKAPKPCRGQGPGGEGKDLEGLCKGALRCAGGKEPELSSNLTAWGPVHSQTEARGSQEKPG